MHHRGRNRIGSEGEPTHRAEAQIGSEIKHHTPDQGCPGVMQRQATQIDVIVGLTA